MNLQIMMVMTCQINGKVIKGGYFMKTLLKILAGIILILIGLFLYLPKIGGIPCLGWWVHLWVIIKGALGGIVILIGLIFFAIAKE